MYLDSPKWHLKKICPNCDQGNLILFTCEVCHKVIAVCDEEGTTFSNPLDISLNTISQFESETCPECKTHGNLHLSKDVELIQLGLTTNDYE